MAFIQIRISEEEKKAAADTFNRMGLSMSAGIKVFLKQVVSRGKLPFEILETRTESLPTTTPPSPLLGQEGELISPLIKGDEDLGDNNNHVTENKWGNFTKRSIG